MAPILRTCAVCGFADAPLSLAVSRDIFCPQCGTRMIVESDEPDDDCDETEAEDGE